MYNNLLIETIVNRVMVQILNEGRNEIKAKENTLKVIRRFFNNASWLDNEYVDPQTPNANPEHLSVIEIIEKRLKGTYFHANIPDSVIRLEPIVMNIALGLGFEQNNPDAQKLERLRSIVSYINNAVRKKLELPIALNKLDLENTTFDTLNELFGSIIDEYENSEEYTINGRDYTDGPNNNYTIEADVSFELAHEVGEYSCPDSKLCYTQSKDTWDQYTRNGAYSVYILLRDGWESEPCVHGENTPYDDYGLSMIFVIIDNEGRLMYSNTRWNHNTNGQGPSNVDQSFTRLQLSELLNMNYFEVFKPSNKFAEAVETAIQRVRNGEDLRDIFDWVRDTNDGYAKVELMGKYNLIDPNGKLLTPDQWYDVVGGFHDGYAEVMVGNQYNFLGTNGKILTPDQWYDWVGNFKDGYARVKIGEKYNFLGTNGKILTPEQRYDGVWDFYNGYAKVKIGEKFNFLGTNGKILTPDQWYGRVDGFYNGYARVRIGEKCNFLGTNGKILTPEQWYDGVWDFNNGYAIVKKGEKCNFLGTNGKILTPEQWYDEVLSFKDGYAAVRVGKKCYFIDTNGELTIPKQYDEVEKFFEGYASVKVRGKWNYIDTNRKLLTPYQWYDKAWFFCDGYAAVEIGGQSYYLDTNGNLYDENENLVEMPNGNNNALLTEAQIRKCIASVVKRFINEGRN